MYNVIFLLVLALIWIIFAVVQDLKKREVANWLNFSLIIFALGFRLFYCLFSQDANGFDFFYQGLIGLGIFFVLGNLFYYGRMFAGGDAKLMIALGTILPFSENFFVNIKIFILFFIIFLLVSAFYGLGVSVFLSIKNFQKFKKEFKKQLKNKKRLYYFFMSIGIILMVLGFLENLLFYLGISIFLLPYFYLYAKAIDESCMVKKVKANQLTEGDWLYHDLKIGKKVIKANWDGLDKKDIKQINRHYKEIKIKQGIPFVPVFLISFVILIIFYFFKIDLLSLFLPQ
jgi:Flp pilus assembly protein protease CpaA